MEYLEKAHREYVERRLELLEISKRIKEQCRTFSEYMNKRAVCRKTR